MSQRKAIRHALCELLDTVPVLSGRVFASRTHPVDAESPGALPCVLVYTERDPGEYIDGYRHGRDLAIRIVVIARADQDADDVLDDLCDAIEDAIEAAMNGSVLPAPDFVSLVDQCPYIDTELKYGGDEGRADLVHAEMTYTARYIRSPAQSFPGFDTLQVAIDMAGPRNEPQLPSRPDGQIDAVATIPLPQ
ncbi:hypothetical protein SAMN06265795_12239 [Noviherbaspirillum humi]|uniref:Gp37 protein n=1 Tax=Noviherbaspirillum humi TaxID=1688639 RepID=A0A239LF16_9BURK|nr:hypothetical protein [Noviherbaspirillum humi]SNT28935.1 hypothetical protein SAMN06265795_12239 [Noviherbaspirillum humi]